MPKVKILFLSINQELALTEYSLTQTLLPTITGELELPWGVLFHISVERGTSLHTSTVKTLIPIKSMDKEGIFLTILQGIHGGLAHDLILCAVLNCLALLNWGQIPARVTLQGVSCQEGKQEDGKCEDGLSVDSVCAPPGIPREGFSKIIVLGMRME